MSDSKASSRKKKIIRSRYKREREGQKDDPGDKGSDSDWGFSEGEKEMAKETKIALSLIFVLLVAFGYVVYQKMTKSEEPIITTVVPEPPTKTKGENEFDPGTNTGVAISNVFGPGDSDEGNNTDQQEPVLEDGGSFFPEDSTSQGENGTTYGQQPDGFNQANSESPFADQPANPQFDPSPGREDFHGSNPSSETQNQFSDNGVKQASQQGADPSPELEMAGDKFSNSFDASDDGRDAEGNPFPQQTEQQQVRYPDNQQFLNKSSDRQELNSEQESYGFGDQSAGDTAFQPGQSDSNQFSESPQYPAENNSQTGQSNLNAGSDFGADIAADDRYRPEPDSSIERGNRFGQIQEPSFAGELTTAKKTTVWRDEPEKFGNSLDASSRLDEASNINQPGVYEVQSGDNYWSISKKQYGTARYFLALSRYNRQRIPDEKRMRPGMKVLTPSPEILQTQFPDLFPKRSAPSSLSQKSTSITAKTSQPAGFFRGRSREPLYRIGEEDTLSEIAQKHLGRSSRWIQIYEMNRSRLPSPNNLTIGTVLQMPADASNVRLVRNTQRGR
jgi:nucleoid-associated protein YgaU